MRGILSWAVYLPYRRLDRTQIAAVAGQGGGRGMRTVASFDEDSATMGVEAARLALRVVDAVPDTVLFATVVPPYADRTNATTLHAALRLPESTAAFDLGASARSAVGGLRLALQGTGTTLVVSADIRMGLAGSAEEANGGDAASAVLIGDEGAGPVVAELIGLGTTTDEFIERWRAPGETRSKVWDEKFAEVRYLPLGRRAWTDALNSAGVDADAIAAVAVAAPTVRLAKSMAGTLDGVRVVDDLSAQVGATGAAQPGLMLAQLLEQAEPGQTVALVVLADGADVLLLHTTPALAGFAPAKTIAAQLATGAAVPYGKYLAWRGVMDVEPPRRPEPQRVSASAAARNEEWKFGFVGSHEPRHGPHPPTAGACVARRATD